MRTARGLRSALLPLALIGVAGAGCAPTPTLRNVLAQHYAGYDQVLPASEALMNEKRYEYLPGNIAAFIPTQPRTAFAAASWSSKSDYCSINIPLSAFKPKKLQPVVVVHDFDLSLRRALGLKKAKADLQLEDNEIEVLRRVEIRIASPRQYFIQKALKPDYVQSCLAEMANRTDTKRIRSILAGDISVKVVFKNNVSFMAKASVLGKLQANLGFGFLSGLSQDLSADNVVFAARLGAVRQNTAR
jgi:hypothetical protein